MFKNLNPSALGVTGHQSEIIELALTYGFRGIDLDIVDFAMRVRRRGIEYAARLIRSARILRAGTFALPLDWEAEEATFRAELAKLPEYAQAAAAMGCIRCLATISPASEKLPYHENFEFYRRRVSEIGAALAPAGVRLGVGFRAAAGLRKGKAFQFIHDLDATMLLLSMAEAKNAGLLLDVWDLTVSGGSIDNIRGIPVEQIVAVRVADLPDNVQPSEAPEEARLLPGVSRRIDIAAILRLLADRGYDGPVTPLPHRSIFGKPRRDAIVRRLGDALDAVWRAAGLPSDYRPHLVAPSVPAEAAAPAAAAAEEPAEPVPAPDA